MLLKCIVNNKLGIYNLLNINFFKFIYVDEIIFVKQC